MLARASCNTSGAVIWPEAVRNFGRGGIRLQTTDGPGEVKRSPGDQPIFVGLRLA